MSPADALVLFSACAAAMASPGPGIAGLVSRASAVGLAGSLPFIAGMIAGDLVLFAAAMLGLAGLAATLSSWMPALSALAGTWLLWLGWKQWRAADAPLVNEGAASASFLAAWLLTIGNPKTIVFYMALLPAIIGPQGLTLADAVLGAGIVAATLAMVMLTYAGLTQAAMGFLRHPRPLRRLCAAIMAGVGLLLLARAGISVY
ncbi:MAG: Lysine exporter protein [Rhodospirillaceae bacterium]|nr:MAG: Lysine exporter protein [Rhodospirillaceae bacterium]TNC97139.1 MAG: Lysine exporter protein (LYSE/YGGA) [Stygiobacter sp.]